MYIVEFINNNNFEIIVAIGFVEKVVDDEKKKVPLQCYVVYISL